MFRNTPRLRQAVTPFALAVVSLLGALALWVAVTDAENPMQDQEFGAAIRIQAINVPEGLAVRSITPDAVRVEVRATEDDFARLTNASFRATVDMTGIREGETERVVFVDVVDVDDVEVVSINSATVAVTLENAATKTVPVRVNRIGGSQAGYVVTEEDTNPDQVTVTGAASLIALVESVAADINLTGVRSNIQQQYNLTARDGTGADVRRIVITPRTAEVRLTIQQQDTYIVLPVVPRLEGSTPPGYRITGVQTDPSTIVANGPEGQLRGLSLVDTEPIDIDGANVSLVREVRLQVPDGVQVSREVVTLAITIEPEVVERVITVAPRVENTPAGLNANVLTSSVAIRVRGEMLTLNDLPAGAVQAVVNAEGLAEGEHMVDVEVRLPEGLNIETISTEPARAMIALTP